MRYTLLFIASVLMQYPILGNQPDDETGKFIEWSVHSSLPPLPGNVAQPGLAENYSGIINGYFIVAGGANFPEVLPWERRIKQYWANIYLYPLIGSGEWEFLDGTLPRKLGYGESVSIPEGILFICGENSEAVYRNPVFEQEEWPNLSMPLANMTVALIDNKIYIAGGVESLENAAAPNHFYVLSSK